jgi:hypothetical protein
MMEQIRRGTAQRNVAAAKGNVSLGVGVMFLLMIVTMLVPIILGPGRSFTGTEMPR